MPMVACEHCGRVDTVVGHTEVQIGQVYRDCPECGHPLRWVRIADAVPLIRERHEADRRRAAALSGHNPG
jgi:hypothetical protein